MQYVRRLASLRKVYPSAILLTKQIRVKVFSILFVVSYSGITSGIKMNSIFNKMTWVYLYTPFDYDGEFQLVMTTCADHECRFSD